MCKPSGNLQQRLKNFFFAITENRGFIFQRDGIIIMRSASYLCIREWVIDFNDSFSNPVFSPRTRVGVMMKSHRSNPALTFDQILSTTYRDVGSLFPSGSSFCDYRLCWANGSLEPEPCRNCPIYLFVSLLFQLSPNSPNAFPALISLFIFSLLFLLLMKR